MDYLTTSGVINLEVVRIKKQQEDGTFIMELKLTDQQMEFLMSFAIGQLVNAGIAKFIDIDDEEENEEQESKDPQSAVDFSKLH